MKRKREDDDAAHRAVKSLSPSTTLATLKSLLDLSQLTAADDIAARFDAIARFLLDRVVLRLRVPAADDDGNNDTGDDDEHDEHGETITDYEILELEFYLFKSGAHEDPFTHGTEEQRQSGQWCVPPVLHACRLDRGFSERHTLQVLPSRAAPCDHC